MTFACPVCDRQRELLQTRKGKPYLVCNDCGVQLFVRYPAGIRRVMARGAGQAIPHQDTSAGRRDER